MAAERSARTGARTPSEPDLRRVERRPASDAEAKALASTLRLRILRLCLVEPLTNRKIADRLDRNPASVLHHVRTLVDTGFLVAEEPRQGRRGAREIPYRATGLSWRLSESARGPRDVLLETFLEEVAAVGVSELDSARLGLALPAEQIEEFRGRLWDLLDEYAQRPFDPAGQRISIFLGIHPEPGAPRPPAEPEG